MKLLGFLLLGAGWVIVLGSLLLLGIRPARAAFVLAGVAIQLLGLALAAHSHMVLGEDHR